MLTTSIPVLILILISVSTASAKVWQVGPSRTYTAPSKVSSLVGNGDTVEIDAGVYESDVTRWTANNLVLRGVGGLAHLKANGTNYGGKGIWVIGGKSTTVEYIEFSLCKCVDKNGAGIRQEGNDLIVRYCYFHDNEDGILGGGDATSNLVIEYSEFYNNGYGDGFSHNLYIGNINSLTFRYNYSHHAVIGHELKSRAYHNYIVCNRLANEADGTASREIDLPNGGTAYIIGNEIQQGTQGDNSNIVGYGLEGLTNPVPHRLFLINNTIVNQRGAGSFVNAANGTAFCKVYNNIFAGPGTVLSGTITAVDSASNLVTTVAGARFINAATYDYRIQQNSPAVDRGTEPGSDDSYPLSPPTEYSHPHNRIIRLINGDPDIGAHEFTIVSGVSGVLVLPGTLDLR